MAVCALIRQIPVTVLSCNHFSHGHSGVFRVSPLMPPPFHISAVSGFALYVSNMMVFGVCSHWLLGFFSDHSSQVNWGRWVRPDFSPQSPSERTDWQTQNAVLFVGEMKPSIKEGRREGTLPRSKRGEHTDVWWQLPERWVTLTLRFSLSPSLCHPHRAIFVFLLGMNLVYLRVKMQKSI